VAGKLRHDPVHAELLSLGAREPFGSVVDIGCGRGQLALAMLESGVSAEVVGLDCNMRLLHQASHAAAGLRFTGCPQDLSANASLPLADTLMLIDVLYQLDTAAQTALLRQAGAAARRMVLIRTPDPALRLRSMLTRMLEHAFRRLLPNTGARVNPPDPAMIEVILTEAGFTIERRPCWRGTPFANILLVARRPTRPMSPGG
jgi:2-polyprenyl-3-methyl-5-hydroxy-6-metoxy-1,4-benzoquinol methylase